MALKIYAGLERAFATHGFAEPNIETLREAAGVSLRTLYKYTPSREDMVLRALEHRHQRYLDLVFSDLPQAPEHVPTAIIDRVAQWMEKETTHGCLFHAAVAAAPRDERLRDLLSSHKMEVARRAAEAAGRPRHAMDYLVVLDGLTQTWPLIGEEATRAAKRLIAGLSSEDASP